MRSTPVIERAAAEAHAALVTNKNAIERINENKRPILPLELAPPTAREDTRPPDKTLNFKLLPTPLDFLQVISFLSLSFRVSRFVQLI